MRISLWLSVVAGVLCGCGGSHGQASAVGALPGAATTETHMQQSPYSGMLPSSSGDLIYATGGCGGTCVFSYPEGRLVGTVPTLGSAACSDSSGNVFITHDDEIIEYAHAGTTPVATLNLPGYDALGCSVDPTTGNLAVVIKGNSTGDIAVFPGAQGTPALYASQIDSFYCGYDNTGDLFVNGYVFMSGPKPAFSEMPAGGSQFTPLSISDEIGTPGQVQWDGNYITYEGVTEKRAFTVSRLSVSGATANIVGTTHFDIRHAAGQSWIVGGNIIIPFSNRGPGRPDKIGIWKYPKGNAPSKTMQNFGYKKMDLNFQGNALSVGPGKRKPRVATLLDIIALERTQH